MTKREQTLTALERTTGSRGSRGALSAGRLLFLTAALACFSAGASAETPSDVAHEILKSMTDYMSGLDSFSFDYSTDLEAVTKEGVKLQFSGSGQTLLDRPAKFRMSRTGGHGDVELISDGKTVTLHGRRVNAYAQNTMPESLEAFVDRARSERGIAIPGADLLLTTIHAELTEPVTQAMYLGTGIVDGVECEHLAFRTADVDWQIWIATGDKPYPCKYVVTSKWVTGAPQYQLRVRNWNDRPSIAADAFSFKPPAGAKKIELADIKDTGLLMPETLKGAKR